MSTLVAGQILSGILSAGIFSLALEPNVTYFWLKVKLRQIKTTLKYDVILKTVHQNKVGESESEIHCLRARFSEIVGVI